MVRLQNFIENIKILFFLQNKEKESKINVKEFFKWSYVDLIFPPVIWFDQLLKKSVLINDSWFNYD